MSSSTAEMEKWYAPTVKHIVNPKLPIGLNIPSDGSIVVARLAVVSAR